MIRLVLGLVALGTVGAFAFRTLPREVSIAAYATPLEGRTAAQRHNAKLAAIELNGKIIRPGEVFSFNQNVGTFTHDQGYRKAPVSYNGQLIDAWGGGVCQTSTTLYNAALLAGLEIVERHPHVFAPGYVPPGRDAAVAYSSIDLRFRNPFPYPVRIRAELVRETLRVELFGAERPAVRPLVVSDVLQRTRPSEFHVSAPGASFRTRNSGKFGWEVAVYRITGNRRERISLDRYPVMHRVVQTP
ncbi:MAG: VanW family protein [Fimbriimonas sp.]